MGSRKNTDSNGIYIFLKSSIYHFFWGLVESRVNYFHTHVPESQGDCTGTPIMPVQSTLGN